MMYVQNLVAGIKCGGKILRESGDIVSLPFGAEFSLILKNLNSVRSQVSVSIDGKDVCGGSRLILGPNSTLELERFIKNGNMQVGNKLKFIERTAGVEEHRGIGIEDGLIRVEAWKELIHPFVAVPVVRTYPWPTHPSYLPNWFGDIGQTTYTVNNTVGGAMNVNACSTMNTASGQHVNSEPKRTFAQSSPKQRPQVHAKSMRGPLRSSGGIGGSNILPSSLNIQEQSNDAGITVPGSESRQQFRLSSGFTLEPNSVVIVLRLRGEVGGKPVVEPVTVKTKTTCETCGKASPADQAFCSKCGTALRVFA